MANYNGKGAFVLPRQLRLKHGVNVETLAAAKTLDKGSSMVQILDPDGVTRMVFWIANNGTGGTDNLTVTLPDASTITVANDEGLMVACDGSQWYKVILA